MSNYTRSMATVLRVLAEEGRTDVESLAGKTDMDVDEVRTAVEDLRQRGDVEVDRITHERVQPTERLLNTGLPEVRILETLLSKGREPLEEVLKETDLSVEDFRAGIGKARELGWVDLLSEDGDNLLSASLESVPQTPLTQLVESLRERGDVEMSRLPSEQREAARKLSSRPGYLTLIQDRREFVEATEEGRKAVESLPELSSSHVTSLTPEMLTTGEWREAEFRPYDLDRSSFRIQPGRRHPLRELIEEVREIFLSLGFEEIAEPLIQLAFWNFDALFQPQDHPARDMQDTFYLEEPAKGDIAEGDLIEDVKATHENGGQTGSKGWGGSWSVEEARRLVLRTHTTVATVRNVYEKGNEPRKSFCIGNVFRNEKPTYRHTAEFFQVDGIIVDEDADLRQLMGIVEEFYSRLGLERVKFWPSYFPYTEPSVQTSVYVEEVDAWVELMGMGIFRPEVTQPLGVDHPVLAWGGGLERMAMLRYDIDDIRRLYTRDIGWLRGRPRRL